MTQEQIAALSDAELEEAIRVASREEGWARRGIRAVEEPVKWRGPDAEWDEARKELAREARADFIAAVDVLGALLAEREHRAWLAEPPRNE